MQASLFDTDDAPARQPADAVTLARAGGRRQAKGAPLADPDAPQVFRDGPNERPERQASPLHRGITADALEAVLSDHAAGTASEDEVYRATRASLAIFDGGELVRVVKGLILVLRSGQ